MARKRDMWPLLGLALMALAAGGSDTRQTRPRAPERPPPPLPEAEPLEGVLVNERGVPPARRTPSAARRRRRQAADERRAAAIELVERYQRAAQEKGQSAPDLLPAAVMRDYQTRIGAPTTGIMDAATVRRLQQLTGSSPEV